MNNAKNSLRLVGVLVLSICAGLPLHVWATEDNSGAWAIFTAANAFQTDSGASRWHYWFDAQARYFDLGSGINQYLVRPGVGYELSDNLTAWAGYARFRSRNRAGNVAYENRYWQQLTWTAGRRGNGTLSMRARLEQRSVSVGNDLGLVLRFSTKYVRPIGTGGNANLILGLEPFVNLKDTDWGGDSGIGQNRAFLGIGWRLGESVSLEAGYMNQFIWVDGAENRINHLGILNFKLKL